MTNREQEIIEQFAAGRRIELIEYKPEPWAKPRRCFPNAEEKVQRDGGSVQYGFEFVRGEGLLKATHHGIWRSPDGRLTDVTPIQDLTDSIYVVAEDGKNLFVCDDSATPIVVKRRLVTLGHDGQIDDAVDAGHWVSLPSRFYPIAKKAKRVAANLNRTNDDNLREIQAAALAV